MLPDCRSRGETMNYMRAIQKICPSASFSMKDVADYSTIEWDEVSNREYDSEGKPVPGSEIVIPAKSECEAIESEVTNEIEDERKDLVARLQVSEKMVEAVALLVVYAGSKEDAPQRLKNMREKLITLVADIKGGE